MITCGHCTISQPEENFNFKNKLTGKRNTICKSCMRISRQKDYQNKKERYFERLKNNKRKNREWFEQYKSTLKCERCPENHPGCLDFHHVNPEEKEGTVSQFAGQTYSIKKTLSEIEKCIVLCSNCHRKLHWDMKNPLDHI